MHFEHSDLPCFLSIGTYDCSCVIVFSVCPVLLFMLSVSTFSSVAADGLINQK